MQNGTNFWPSKQNCTKNYGFIHWHQMLSLFVLHRLSSLLETQANENRNKKRRENDHLFSYPVADLLTIQNTIFAMHFCIIS